LAFAWLATITITLLVIFLSTWTFLHRKIRVETCIFKSNIKQYLVDGFISLPASPTGMSASAPSTSVVAKEPQAAAVTPEPSAAQSLQNSLATEASYPLEKEVEQSSNTLPGSPA
jgi:hypothetical protein